MRSLKAKASEHGDKFSALDAAIAVNLKELGYGG
jgi:hypothetical protein